MTAAPRTPDSLPDPDRPAGSPDETLPFEHVVVIVMENHSFDNLLGALPIFGQPLADGLSFDAEQVPVKVTAVLRSPAWPRTLLIYTYDEHGGYYDHVPPPPVVPPDDTPPKLSAGDAPGGYDMYGVRVPAVIASPYAKPSSVSDVIHDHTSVLATIEQRWNLPALTYRDANANTVLDLIDPRRATLLEPPTLENPNGN